MKLAFASILMALATIALLFGLADAAVVLGLAVVFIGLPLAVAQILSEGNDDLHDGFTMRAERRERQLGIGSQIDQATDDFFGASGASS